MVWVVGKKYKLDIWNCLFSCHRCCGLGWHIVLYVYSVLGWLVLIDPCTVVGNTTVQLLSLIVGLPGNKMENAVLVVKCK
jgi:hypothetical protein